MDTARQQSAIAAVKSLQAAALVCFLPSDVLLLTGYWPVMGGTLAVLTADGELAVILPEDEVDLAKASLGDSDGARLIPYKPVTLEQLDAPGEALFAAGTRLLAELRLPAGALATSLGTRWQPKPYLAGHRFDAQVSGWLAAALPGREVVAADEVLERLQSIKTEPELARIRHACELAAVGYTQASKSIAPGMREDEVAAEVEAAFARVAREGFERGGGYFFCMSGPNSAKAAGAYARTRRRVIEAGDLVMVHANTFGDGYWTDITRTFTAGTPSAEQQRMYDAIAEARAAAYSAVKPGVRASDVDRAARGVLARHGFAGAFKHATGHGVGFAAANPHAAPRLHPASPDILEAGMSFNIEPAIYFDGVEGMRHCDVVLCSAQGAENFTNF